MYAGAVVFDKGQAVGRRGVAGWTTRHQAWLFVPMLTLEALNLHLSGVLAVLRPGLRHRRVEAVMLAVHVTAYVSLLVFALTWQQALVFFLVHQALSTFWSLSPSSPAWSSSFDSGDPRCTSQTVP